MTNEMINNVMINQQIKQNKTNDAVAIVRLLYSLGWRMTKEDRILESPESVLIEYIDMLE